MANPAVDGQGGAEAAKRTRPLWRWFDRPTPRWAIVLALIALGAAAGLRAWLAAGDVSPKRWQRLDASIETRCYSDLVNPKKAPPDGDCVLGQDRALAHTPHDWDVPHVSVYSVAAPHEPAPADATGRGQTKERDATATPSAMSPKAPTEPSSDQSGSAAPAAGEKDPFRFDRVLVATVAKGAKWDLGDRMIWTRVFVQPINFSFAGYSVAATDNETVKLTSVESTYARKFSADIGLTVPGLEGPKAGLSPSTERAVKTTSEINAQYERLGVDIMPTFLRVIRESETGGDVAGNTTVSLTAVTDAQTIRKRFPTDDSRHDGDDDDIVLLVTGTHFEGDFAPEKGQPADGADHQTTIDVLPQVPVPHCALRARVWMLYEWRQVDEGRESYDESKQKVTIMRDAEDRADVEIMNADEVSPAVWSLKKCAQTKCDDDSKPLTATVKDTQRYRKVVFTDYGVAVKLAHWLRTNKQSTPAGSNYTFDYGPNSKESLIPVKSKIDECQLPQAGDVAAAKGSGNP